MIKTPSNEGSSSGVADVKYQKAIKQISKLISLNTALKKQIGTLQQSYDKLRTEHESLEEKYSNLEFQMQQFKTTRSHPASAPHQSKSVDQSAVHSTFYKDHLVSQSIQKFIQNKKQIQNFQVKLAEKDEKIQSLKKELQSKIAQNGQIYKKYLDVTDQLAKTKINQNAKNFQAAEKQRKKLKKQLEQSQQWVKKISNDYQLLKKQLMFNQKASINANSIQMGMGTSAGPMRDPLSDFYFEKLRKSEAEIIKLKKQNSQKKMKYKNDLNKLRQQNNEKLKKLMHLTVFVQKQQTFIQKFILAEKSQNL